MRRPITGSSTRQRVLLNSSRFQPVPAEGLTFAEGENDGTVTITVRINGTDPGYIQFANEGEWATGTPVTISTECEPAMTLLAAPAPPVPAPAACQVALTGQTSYDATTNQVITRDKYGVGGEVNADGWGKTWRLYGATDVEVENAVFTWDATQGFTFGEGYNSVSNPGAGNLDDSGYTTAVDGLVITVTGQTVTANVASMPAGSSFSFNVNRVMNEGVTTAYMNSTMIADDPNCDPVGPPAAPIPAPAVCQVALTGQTGYNANSNEVITRDKYGDGGEVNADGWGKTWRLYGATDVEVENAVFTWEATQGFTFGSADGTQNTPGGGALQGNGYTVAVEGLVIEVNPGMVTATVASMPANSSFSFNVTRVMNEGTNFAYMNSTMVADIPNCAAAELEVPVLTPATCNSEGEAVPPSLAAPADSQSVTYGEVTVAGADNGVVSFMQVAPESTTFNLTATANDGYTFEGVTLPEGWTYVSPTEANYSITVEHVVCEVPTETPGTETPTETPVTETPTETPEADEPTATAAPVTGLPSTGNNPVSGQHAILGVGFAAILAAAMGIWLRPTERH